MTLLWPDSLLLLGAIPVLIALYFWILRRRRRFSRRYSSLELVRQAGPQHARWRRHVPFALFLLALGSLTAALSRPYRLVNTPSDQAVVILALDVSRSMCATDITPNRLLAAESAALGFIQRQKPGTQIGVVAFSGFAELIQSPTTDPERLQSAIQSLELGSTTAIGSGILKSLDAIAEADPNVYPSQVVQALDAGDGQGIDQAPEGTPAPSLHPQQPDIIILLTDGVNNVGPQPLDAARQAAERGVRIYTIGYGTAAGSLYPDCPSNLVGGDPTSGFVLGEIDSYHHSHGLGGYAHDQEQVLTPLGGNASGGSSTWFPRGIDEETLKKVAALTGGSYYAAESAGQLQQVFNNLAAVRILHRTADEVSVEFAALGALLATLAVGLSLYWNPLG
jgi:Ca-activated chloride channel homolog